MRCLISLSALLLAAPALAQSPPAAPAARAVQVDPTFATRAQELLGVLAGTTAYDAYFAPAFVTAIPKPQFDGINAQLTAAYGKPVAATVAQATGPWQAAVHVRFEKAVVAFQLTLDPAAPHLATGLRVLGPVAQEASLDEVTAALDKLPGAASYAFARLGDGAPSLTLAHNAQQPLAVGSAFKLVILAELIRVTNAGTRKWDDLVTLDGKPLPGGGYAMKLAGTKVSLRELATQMISISDNSATDILLADLGREKIEAMLGTLGVAPDPRNIPYLGTLEAFKLKWLDGGKLGERYIAADDRAQRAMLAGEVLSADIAPLKQMRGLPGKPSSIDQLEWFFSSADLIRVMDWLRRNTEGPAGAEARAVLSKNQGLTIEKTQYGWVGFKGGSEPGVINLTYLLHGTDGNWYAATATWNDTAALVDDARFAGLVTGLLKFAGPRK
ncbi:MAG: hypothetical protein EOP59_00805 [Sphingomonadales bacterium]|nr:MAG: hypothetical protein EOP59_00805 [Sphingomonadales bacterium]